MANINGNVQQVARHIYEVCLGNIEKGKVLRHKCDNPRCCNPAHLETGTIKENQQDMKRRGRSFKPKGEINGNSKLNSKKVKKIKEMLDKKDKEIANKFGVSRKCINDIRNGNRWSHI
ncbi:MAG: HNH endonuclease [Thermoplasmatota archaeon]